MSIRPFLTTHIPINLPPLRPFHTDRMAALTFHPAACFFPRPREAAATAKQPLHHYCSPLRTLVPRTTRPCLLRARSSNGLPQIGGASFGSSNGIRWNMRAWSVMTDCTQNHVLLPGRMQRCWMGRRREMGHRGRGSGEGAPSASRSSAPPATSPRRRSSRPSSPCSTRAGSRRFVVSLCLALCFGVSDSWANHGRCSILQCSAMPVARWTTKSSGTWLAWPWRAESTKGMLLTCFQFRVLQ